MTPRSARRTAEQRLPFRTRALPAQLAALGLHAYLGAALQRAAELLSRLDI
jgi:hypothetical protein